MPTESLPERIKPLYPGIPWPKPMTKLDKLYRNAKCGRPGIKTEYNLKYRDWTKGQGKYDNISVSYYSEKAYQDKKRCSTSGYPCSAFSGALNDKDVALQAMDPYADEWFDDYDLSNVLKTKAAKMHERPPCPKQSNAKQKARPPGSVSPSSSRTKFIKKMAQVNQQIDATKSHLTLSGSSASDGRQNAWFSSSASTIKRKPKKQLGVNKRNQAWVSRASSFASNSNTSCTSSFQETSITPQNSGVSNTTAESEKLRIKDLYTGIDKLKMRNEEAESINSYKPKEVKEARSEQVFPKHSPSFHSPTSNETNKQRPATASSVTERKKKKIDTGNPNERSKNVYKELTSKDKQFLKKLYNGLEEWNRKKSMNDVKGKGEVEKQMHDDIRRANQYPCYRADFKDWNTTNTEAYSYPEQRDVDKNNHNAGDKKQESEDKKQESGDKKHLDANEEYTDSEREKLIAEGNKILARDQNNQATVDGRWTTYDASYSKKEPLDNRALWAEKTFKSLGSGFWNLPFNKDEFWKNKEKLTEEEINALKMGQKQLKKDNWAGERDKFLEQYYPEMRTKPSYLTEYLAKYHRMPLNFLQDLE